MEPYLCRIEWETSNDEVEVRVVTAPSPLDLCLERLTIRRDEDYRIVIKAFAKHNTAIPDLYSANRPGDFITPFDISGTDKYGTDIFELKGCIILSTPTKLLLQEGDEYVTEASAFIRPNAMEYHRRSAEETAWLTEWYLNAPDAHSFCQRQTSRESSTRYERTRRMPGEAPRKFMGTSWKSTSSDYCLIQLENLTFVLHAVPKDIVPLWSSKLGIEYNKSFGEIPKEETRTAVAEICSFILGRQLLSIGHTEFDSVGNVLSSLSNQPWGHGRSDCGLSWLGPVRLEPLDFNESPETLLTKLAPAYLENLESLGMRDALWRYWISKRIPAGMRVPLLANAVEILAMAWYKSNKSKTKGVYMDTANWNKFLDAYIAAIGSGLDGNAYKDRIVNRLKSCNTMGAGERLDFFFKEIGLDVGEAERAALKARNAFVHSAFKSTDGSQNEVVRITRVYETLFHRVILKMLGHNGSYIDYATNGWPNVHIDIPAGAGR